jgi:hypothetical protein
VAREFVATATVQGPLAIPPLAITPPRSVHICRPSQGPNLQVEIDQVAGATVVERITHTESATLALVTQRVVRPRFLRLDLLDHPVYEVHLVTYVDEAGVLFVSTSTMPALQDLLDAYAPGERRRLSGPELRRILSAARLERFFSVGTRAARSQAANTSYRTTAGRRTDNDIRLRAAAGISATGWAGAAPGLSGSRWPRSRSGSPAQRRVCTPSAGGARAKLALSATRPVHCGQASSICSGRVSPSPSIRVTQSAALWPVAMLVEGYTLVVDGEVLVPERVELWPTNASTAEQIDLEVRVDGISRAHLTVAADATVTLRGADVRVRSPEDAELTELDQYLRLEPVTIFFARGERATGERLAPPPPAVVNVAV